MTISSGMIFSPPQAPATSHRIVPVFLPFAGCKKRCLYCAQPVQTGQAVEQLEDAYARLERELEEREQLATCDMPKAAPVEIGFYGGTFTALPGTWTDKFLRLANRYRERGIVAAIRCSTRPDCVDVSMLCHLKALGLDTVELGIQSFDEAVLRTSLRGYGQAIAVAACHAVHEAGLTLGIQLLPGLPGHSVALFMEDMHRACELAPSFMRLYPCVVFRNTGLAAMHARGEFIPWTLDATADACAQAVRLAWRHGVRIIRIGVAQDADMAEQIIAGPYHTALGSMVRGRALVPFIRNHVETLGRPPRLLLAPPSARGEFWGYRGECKEQYAAMGLTPAIVRWWTSTVFCLL